MVESLNTKIDLNIKGNFLGRLSTSRGDILIGDRAFEYYNERNPRDYIQIPYGEIRLVTASVIFKRKINRFAIHTRKNGDFIFNSTDNKKLLRALNKYIASDKLRRSLGIMDYIKKIFKR